MAGGIRLRLLVCALLFGLCAAVYAPLAHNGFVAYDDDGYVLANETVRRGLSLDGLRWALVSAHSSNWHPLTWLSHMLDVELFGLDAGAHHLVSLAWHAANAVLLFLALDALGLALGQAAFVAAAFAVHPLRVESVAWVAERKDLLAGAGWMLALLAWARFARTRRGRDLGLVALALGLSLCAKPMAVSLPLVLLLLDRWPLARAEPWAARVREKLPLALLCALACGLALWAQGSSGALRSFEALPLAARVSNACTAALTYAAQTVWPHDLAVLHPHAALLPGYRPFDAAFWASALVLAALSLVAWRARARAGWLFTGWLWFLLALLPVIGLVQVGDQAWAERYAYLPTIGLLLAGAGGATALARALVPAPARTPLLAALAGAFLVPWALAARAQTAVWRSTQTLFERALAVTRDNATAHLNLGLALVADGRLDEGLAHYEAALAIRPADRLALYDAALVHLRQGAPPRALARLDAALAADPAFAPAHALRGVVLGRMGRLAEARASFEQALALAPDDAAAEANLGALLVALGEARAACAHLRRALARDPRSTLAAERLAWVLATAADPALRAPAEALRWAELAARRSDDPGVQATLAAAQAASGDFEAAARTQRAALARAPAGLRAAWQERLARYASGRAWQEEGR